MDNLTRPHIVLPNAPESLEFTSKSSGGSTLNYPERDRISHGNATDLAACNIVEIYPIIGWWRERHNLGCFNKQTRYSLIVSLEVPEQDVDIYTTVYNMVAVPVEIKV